jgi:hypothetical protein
VGGGVTDMTSIERQLERIERKLDKVTDDHEKRIRALERSLWVAGGIALAGTGTGVVSVLNIMFGGGA